MMYGMPGGISVDGIGVVRYFVDMATAAASELVDQKTRR